MALGIVFGCGTLNAQCYIDPCTGERVCARQLDSPQAQAPSSQSPFNSTAHCRISVADGCLGSGTLVACDDSGGLVLTCSHLFDGSTGPIVVTFPNGQRFAANLIDRDRAHDLAALAIRRPNVLPVTVSAEETASPLTACGFGPNGQFRCVRGAAIGQALAAGATYPSLTIRGAVRPGDSGGGVLNPLGELVGVVWGQRDGLTYATCGRPVREFLARVRGRSGGGDTPARGPQLDLRAWSNEIDARLRALDAKKQDKGEYLQPGDLNGYLRTADAPKIDSSHFIGPTELDEKMHSLSSSFDSVRSQIDSVRQVVDRVASNKAGVLAGLSWGKLAVGALGLSGPLAAAVVVAGGLVGRRAKRASLRVAANTLTAPRSDNDAERVIAVDTPPPRQRTVPETHYVPIEKDSFAKAHQWASEQVARKYPGATEVLQAQDSLIKQFLASH